MIEFIAGIVSTVFIQRKFKVAVVFIDNIISNINTLKQKIYTILKGEKRIIYSPICDSYAVILFHTKNYYKYWDFADKGWRSKACEHSNWIYEDCFRSLEECERFKNHNDNDGFEFKFVD